MKKVLILLAAVAVITAGFPPTVFAVGATEGQAPSGIAFSELEGFIDEFADGIIGTETVGAAVAIVQDGTIIFNKAYGDAIVGERQASTDDVWEWGSVTKLLIWTSAFQLAEQGKLDLNTDIRQYLPQDFIRKLRYDTPITFYNLMHHNAGWEDRYTDLFHSDPAKVRSLEESLRAAEPNQIFEPGAVMAYSNYGTGLAGFIIERLSGEVFSDYVNNHIFRPLGMNDTSIHPTQADNPAVSARRDKIIGYRLAGKGFVPVNNERLYIGIYPAGGVIGTSADAAKLIIALLDDAAPLFNNPATQAEMLTTSQWFGANNPVPFPGIAHGFWENITTVRTLGHGGNTLSFSAKLVFSPDTGFGVVVLTNQAGEERFCSGLVSELFGEYAPELDTAGFPDAQTLAGVYVSSRRPHSGFTKIMQSFVVFEAEDENTLRDGGVRYRQVSPYVFWFGESDENLDIGTICFDVKDGAVIHASMMYGDLLPASRLDIVFVYSGFAMAGIGGLYAVVSSIMMPIGIIKRKRRETKSCLVQKLNIALCISLLLTIINNAILIVRTFSLTAAYTSLQAHFTINIVYAVFVPVCAGLMIWKRNDAEMLKKSKVFCIFTIVCSVIFAVFLCVWEFYC